MGIHGRLWCEPYRRQQYFRSLNCLVNWSGGQVHVCCHMDNHVGSSRRKLRVFSWDFVGATVAAVGNLVCVWTAASRGHNDWQHWLRTVPALIVLCTTAKPHPVSTGCRPPSPLPHGNLKSTSFVNTSLSSHVTWFTPLSKWATEIG